MPPRRHPKRYVYCYSAAGAWWHEFARELEERIAEKNEGQLALLAEHWQAKPGLAPSALKRAIRADRAVICLTPEHLTDAMVATLQSRVAPVHVIGPKMTQAQRFLCEKYGWHAWLSTQFGPSQVVADVIRYCYAI